MLIFISLTLLIISFLYSSVGHGGASGYIAILALFGYNAIFIRQDALMLNILVSGIALFNFYRQGYFNKKLLLSLVLGSVPMAFLGGTIGVEGSWYKLLLGAILLIPGFLFLVDIKPEPETRKLPKILGLTIGLILGFISGLTGIGGGVFLSPILVLGKWAGQKTTAATSAAFILVNSIAGLLGTFKSEFILDPRIGYFAMATLLGGFLGSSMGATFVSASVLKKILGFVLLIASVKLLFA